MKKFYRYNSIENSYRKKTVEQVYEHGFNRGTWIVNEKCHGSNFSFTSDGYTVLAGKRSGYLSVGEKFFNWEMMLSSHHDKILDLFEKLNEDLGNIKEVRVFGEYYGGKFEHPDVERLNVSKIQSEVQYRPDQAFHGFDIVVTYDKEKSDTGRKYTYENEFLSTDQVVKYLGMFDIEYAPTLYEGSFEECMEYSCEFVTKIPDRLGLPRIEDNIAEGTVIRPVTPVFFGNGSRCILKNKNPKFNERDAKVKKPRVEYKMTEEGVVLHGFMQEFVTGNRLKNVLSHIGEVTNKDFGKVMKAFSSDAIKDFMKDYQDRFTKLDKKEQKIITKSVAGSGATLIRKNFLNIIDGEY